MKQLTVDIGNTRIGSALITGTTVVDRYEGNPASTGQDAESRVAAAFDWCLDQTSLNDDLGGVVIASVVPAQSELLRAMLTGHPDLQGLPVHEVSHASVLPMRVAVQDPETVGADRLCNVAAAMVLGHREAIVVDLGTANTFDLLEDGVFRGGLIGPGAVTAHRALIAAGDQLPAIAFSWPDELVGRNTTGAILSGSFHQAVGAVSHVIDRLRRQCPTATVLVTGGMAEMLAPELGDRILYRPSLTHIGAAAIGAESGPRGD